MFKLAISPAYWWKVEVNLPAAGDVAGKVDTADFDVEFVRMGEEAFRKLADEVAGRRINDTELVSRVVRNFRNVHDDVGASLPFSAANLATLCDIPGVAAAVVTAFFDSRCPAAEKN